MPLLLGLFCLLLLSCETQQKDTKKTHKVAKNTLPTFEKEQEPQTWRIIKSKSKYKQPQKFSIETHHQTENWLQKYSTLSNEELVLLNLKNRYKVLPSGNAYHFYGFQENDEYLLGFVLAPISKYGSHALLLLSYDKTGKLLQDAIIADKTGDMGYIWDTKSQFLNDSTLQVSFQEDCFSDSTFVNICQKYTYQLQFLPTGKFIETPHQYSIKQLESLCYERGKAYFEAKTVKKP